MISMHLNVSQGIHLLKTDNVQKLRFLKPYLILCKKTLGNAFLARNNEFAAYFLNVKTRFCEIAKNAFEKRV